MGRDNRFLLFLFVLSTGLLFAHSVRAQDRIDVYNYYPDQGGITFYSPTSPDIKRPCFPFGCGGIGPVVTNPNPRKSSDKPACYYDAKGTLFYERKGKTCPYKYVDLNVQRVERRRQEWLRQQKGANKTRR